MEFKTADTEERMSNKVNEETLRQMEDKQYDVEFTKRGYSTYGNMVLRFMVKMKNKSKLNIG